MSGIMDSNQQHAHSDVIPLILVNIECLLGIIKKMLELPDSVELPMKVLDIVQSSRDLIKNTVDIKPHFDPAEFVKRYPEPKVGAFRLSEDNLK